MKFLLCLVLCFAAVQAGFIGVPSALSYAAPYSAYSAGLPLSSLYNSPLAYSAYAGFPTAYTSGLGLAPTVYNTAGLGLGSPLLSSAYAAPLAYSGPSVYSTLLKK